jgi:phosphoribosylanthranilate isomerase
VIAPGSVKICSLREIEHAQYVINAGADMFGLIFVPGVRRQVTVERGAEIAAAVRSRANGQSPRAVGVFVDASPEEINRTARLAGLDLAQLQGNEPPEMLSEIDLPVIRAIRPRPDQTVADVRIVLESYLRASRPPVAFHFEGISAGHGGEGARADWELVGELARDYPVILAGGLSPENVAGAIAAVRPIGVDVSSGVETDGVKDPAKIAAFARAARSSFSLAPN